MLLHPTRRALHLSWAGVLILIVGVLQQKPSITLYGAAIILAIATARSWSRISVARARAAGFEMLWLNESSATHCQTHQSHWLTLQLRNRDSLPTRFVDLSVMAASQLKIEPELTEGEIPAQGSLNIRLKVTPLQLGVHGIFGISLATLRAPGLYRVPLAFTNPHVLQVEPRRDKFINLMNLKHSRARNSTAGYSARGGEEGQDIRDIREKQPGDPFKRIAWKPSARRGKLLVIDREDESRERVWIIVDCSSELFGMVGENSAINQQAERVRMLCHKHLQRGDLVGLALMGSRKLFELAPNRGPKHQSLLEAALTFKLHTLDSDRSGWDAEQVAFRALEFISHFDASARLMRTSQREQLAVLAQALLKKAPMKLEAPLSDDPNDQILRQLLLSFGIQSPPKLGNERRAAELQITDVLHRNAVDRNRSHVVHLLARMPTVETPTTFFNTLALMRRRRISVIFHPVERIIDPRRSFSQTIEDDLKAQRTRQERQELMRELRARGVKTQRSKSTSTLL